MRSRGLNGLGGVIEMGKDGLDGPESMLLGGYRFAGASIRRGRVITLAFRPEAKTAKARRLRLVAFDMARSVFCQ